MAGKVMDRQKEVPKGKIKRSGIIGATTARAGIKKLGYISKKPFLSSEKQNQYKNKNDEDIAQIIFRALGMLKGAPLKLAQMLAMEIELLPEAYRKELAKCAYQVPSINRALIRKVIKQELGDWPEKIYKSFEAVPFAAASLGQVHKAVSHEGDELAVKVQYPGIAAGTKSDMDMIKAIFKMTPYSKMLEGAIKEIELRIYEELDYTNEAGNTNYFRENLKLDNVIVPLVYDDLSTETVLTTSRINGLHLDAWLNTNPVQEKRDYYGQLLCDVFSFSFYQNMLIHADPNIGNFLFRDDGKLGLIDFGCVKKIESNFPENFKKLLNSFNEINSEKIKEVYSDLGIYYKADINEKEFNKFISSWIEWVMRPIRADFFDFAPPDYFLEAKKYIPKIYSYIERFDGSMLYFGRTEYGLYRILHRLGAKVKMKIF
jgi:predicted unusual protein kinase regulating ubiquinone biosynthesis (AarF/ABC1/UbiB family)